MKRHLHTLIIVFASLLCGLQFLFVSPAMAQVVPDSYRLQKQQEFQDFSDSVRDEFIRYLEQRWTEYQLFEGEHSPRAIKPKLQPVIDTTDTLGDSMTLDGQLPYGNIVETMKTESVGSVPPSRTADYTKQNVSFVFYGRKVDQPFPVSVMRETLSGIRERQVARFMNRLNKSYVVHCVAALDQQCRSLYLCDWGLLDLVRHFAAAVYPNLPNEQTVLAVYLLDAMRYDVRVGRVDNHLVMLVNTDSRLYDVPYVDIDSVRYYAFGNFSYKGRIHTYERQMESADHAVDMNLVYSPRLGGQLAGIPFRFTFRGKGMTLQVNQPLMDFYASYPQTELSIYANAALEEAFSVAIEREMRPFVEGESPVGALNNLLEFMQQGFKYQTDRKQFGHEKNFFCEENFYYPANDCEDRAVLFARIVKVLLGYDVVLLEYTDHVATAVHIPGRKVHGHHIDIDGQRYMVCDPTSLGAAVGDLGRKYRDRKANIILINKL